MNRIIGKGDKYLNTAVVVPIAALRGEPHIVFERRSPDIPEGDEVCFPAGHVGMAVDDCSEHAAIREVCEELGLSGDRVVIRCYWGTILAPLRLAVDTFIGKLRISSLDEITPNAAEVQSVFSIPVEWFRPHTPQEYRVVLEVHPFDSGECLLPVAELGLPKKYERPWRGMKLPVYVYTTDHGIIWGITAEIVRDFINNWG